MVIQPKCNKAGDYEFKNADDAVEWLLEELGDEI